MATVGVKGLTVSMSVVCRFCSGVVLLADEMVSIGTVGLDPVILERSAEHQTVHTGRGCRRRGVVVNGNRLSSRGGPARVADRLEMVFRRPHPLLVTDHEVTARPPTVDVLIFCAPDTRTRAVMLNEAKTSRPRPRPKLRG